MAKHSSITIVDIAKKLQISPSTVSRALKDHPKISQKTKKRVAAAAKEMGYRKNAMAANLRSQKSYTIGLIVPRIALYFQSTAVTAIQNTLHKSGYNLIVCQSNDSLELEKELVNTLFNSQVDGLITSSTMYTMDFSHFNLFSDHEIPMVFYDRVPEVFPAMIIRGDDYNGGYQVGKHFVEAGCHDIAFINGLLSCNLYRDRQKGFQDALNEKERSLKAKRIFNQLLTKENAITSCEKIFASKPFPDAIFCTNDTTAIEVHHYIKKLGLKIPEDIKVVGYSNDPRSEIIEPSLSSVEQYADRMGEIAAKTILKLLKGKEDPTVQKEILVPTDLILRASS